MYLLDTNVCIRLLNEAHPGILSQFQARSPNTGEFGRVIGLRMEDWEHAG